jgi:3-phenylpropionate/cinnamic acid dioxygenase small subunit
MNSAIEITNLLYRYNEYIDQGDLAGAADMFKYAKLKLRGYDELQDGTAVLPMLQRFVIIYSDGTPKTKHIVTNPIVEIDEEAGKANTRSQYTVFQVTEDIPMQVIAAGGYHDSFERVDGQWRFSYRNYTLFNMAGNISGHLKNI